VDRDRLIELARSVGGFIEDRLRDPEARRSAGRGAFHVDLEAEAFLKREIAGSGTLLIAEDAPPSGEAGGPVLVADVLDGSRNAVQRLPLYNVSLALGAPTLADTYTPDAIETAVVYCPPTNVLHVASRGKGAWRNGVRMTSQRPTAASDALSVGALYSREYGPNAARVLGAFGSHRVLGCATEHICAVARGDSDAFIALNGRLRSVDIAAALLIAEEAGAAIVPLGTPTLGGSHNERFSLVVASSQTTGQLIQRMITARCHDYGSL
jgi:myo-inositol-1(or 4)-monophosphatase